MPIEVLSVIPGSLADKSGIVPGDMLMEINGEPVLDEIDYQDLTTRPDITLVIRKPSLETRTVHIRKGVYSSLGLHLDERTILQPRLCKNHCVFCFVDQLPKGMRDSLYVRDDDWRLSLMMGNFVTLTNVDDEEFERILRRRASPLYISVHATDPDTRVRLLKNPHAGNIMQRLRRMKDCGIHFHCQVVLCPGLNDGLILHQTMIELASLAPAALSLAIVPVGMTLHREGLTPIPPVTREMARDLIREIGIMQEYFFRTIGTRFVFASDEMYCIAGLPVPPEDEYEGYPQIENGVGMLRQLAQECEDFWPDFEDRGAGRPAAGKKIIIATGFSACDFIRDLASRYAPPDAEVTVVPVPNRFFGETVTVSGLIVGQDLIRALRDRPCDLVLISESMLRENTESFLDNMTLSEVREALGVPVRAVPNHGEEFIRALYEAGG